MSIFISVAFVTHSVSTSIFKCTIEEQTKVSEVCSGWWKIKQGWQVHVVDRHTLLLWTLPNGNIYNSMSLVYTHKCTDTRGHYFMCIYICIIASYWISSPNHSFIFKYTIKKLHSFPPFFLFIHCVNVYTVCGSAHCHEWEGHRLGIRSHVPL